MPSRTDELFPPAWNRPMLGTLWLRHPQLREHPRESLPRHGQRAVRCKARELRRTDRPQLFATRYLQNSYIPSRPFVWIALFLTYFFRRQFFERLSVSARLTGSVRATTS